MTKSASLLHMSLRIVVPHLNDYDQFLTFIEAHKEIQKENKDHLQFEIWDGGSKPHIQESIKSHCAELSWQAHFPSQRLSLVDVLNGATNQMQSNRIMILPVDCHVSRELIAELLNCSEKWHWGGFPKKYQANSFFFSIYLYVLNNLFARTGRFVWTNGLFFDSSLAQQIQWQNKNLLVDWHLSEQLRKEYPYYLGTHKILVNPRKYLKNGMFRQVFINAIIILFVSLGLNDEDFLKKLYK